MKQLIKLCGLATVALLVVTTIPSMAQDKTSNITEKEVRTEISQAMDAIANYSNQERDQALAEARDALDKVDAEIERREHALQENWAEMSEAARKSARSSLKDLRKARNNLAQRYGALEAGTSNAWDELKSGFSAAWKEFSEAWEAADKNSK